MKRASSGDIGRWRAALEADTTVLKEGSCPPADTIWASAAGSATPTDEEVFDHVFACGACSAAWRAARELQHTNDRLAWSPPRLPAGTGWAIAAFVILAAGIVPFLMTRSPSTLPAYRALEGTEISATSPKVLPREQFILEWHGAPAGSTYDVRVVTADLVALKEVFGIHVPRLQVPPEALAELAEGTPVLWKVTSRLPDGRSIASVTFTTRLQ